VGVQAPLAHFSCLFLLIAVKGANEDMLKGDYRLAVPQIEYQIMEAFGHT